MSILRNCLLTAGLLLAVIAVPTFPSNGGLERKTGCASVLIDEVLDGSQVVLDIQASGCRGPDGGASTSDAVSERVARTAWTSLPSPVAAVRLTITGSRSPSDATVRMDRAELVSRFGPGPSGVTWVEPDLTPDSDRIWMLLPAAFAATGLAAAASARRMRRAGIAVVLLRR